MGTEGLGRQGPPLGFPSRGGAGPARGCVWAACAAGEAAARGGPSCGAEPPAPAPRLGAAPLGKRDSAGELRSGLWNRLWNDHVEGRVREWLTDWRFTELTLLWGSPCSSDSWRGGQGVAGKRQGECGRGSPRWGAPPLSGCPDLLLIFEACF